MYDIIWNVKIKNINYIRNNIIYYIEISCVIMYNDYTIKIVN